MKFLLAIFLLPLQLFAQDITGVWTGTLYNDTTKRFIRYELAISEYNGLLSGYSHTIFVIDSFENTGLKSIKVRKEGNRFLVEDDKLIYNNYTEPPARGVRTYSSLVLSQNDTAMILSGRWNTNRTKVYKMLTGDIFLKKKKKIKETLIIEELENLGLTGSLSFMTSPAQPEDLIVVNKNDFNSIETRPVDSAKDIVLNTGVLSNTRIPTTLKQSKSDEPISEAALNKESATKEKITTNSMQLPSAAMAVQKDKADDVILPTRISSQPTAEQINTQYKTGKKISGKVLNKDSVLNNTAITKGISTTPEIPAPKKEPANIVSIKSTTEQPAKQDKTVKENSVTRLNKDSALNNTAITKGISLIPGIPALNNETAKIGSVKSTAEQPAKQDKTVKENSVTRLNKDSALNNTAITKGISTIPEIPALKKESVKIVSIKSTAEQPGKQGEIVKENSVTRLNRDTALNNNKVKGKPLLIAAVSAPEQNPGSSIAIKSASRSGEQGKTVKGNPNAVLKTDSLLDKSITQATPSHVADFNAGKEPIDIASAKSTSQQTGNKTGKENPGIILRKDSAVHKNIVQNVSPGLAEITRPEDRSRNILPADSTQQNSNQQKIVTQMSAGMIAKNNREGIKATKPAIAKPAAELATRKIETIRSVDIKSDSLVLTLYDNGEIDGDTVSVLLNGSVIMPMQGLMSKAINKTIYLTPEMGDSIVLIMYAENLGSIPPNTGLLVIHDGDDTYEIRFTGDLEKNSSIILKKKRRN